MSTSSVVENKQNKESICSVRRMWGLGCDGCVLNGFKECSNSIGGRSYSPYTLKVTAPNKVRGDEGFPLHLDLSKEIPL